MEVTIPIAIAHTAALASRSASPEPFEPLCDQSSLEELFANEGVMYPLEEPDTSSVPSELQVGLNSLRLSRPPTPSGPPIRRTPHSSNDAIPLQSRPYSPDFIDDPPPYSTHTQYPTPVRRNWDRVERVVVSPAQFFPNAQYEKTDVRRSRGGYNNYHDSSDRYQQTTSANRGNDLCCWGCGDCEDAGSYGMRSSGDDNGHSSNHHWDTSHHWGSSHHADSDHHGDSSNHFHSSHGGDWGGGDSGGGCDGGGGDCGGGDSGGGDCGGD